MTEMGHFSQGKNAIISLQGLTGDSSRPRNTALVSALSRQLERVILQRK